MSTFPQPPLNDASSRLSRPWHLWYDRLSKFLADTAGLIPWTSVSKVGSNLTDLTTRNHADLQNINTSAYTHFTAIDHADLTDAGDSSLHFHSADRARANHTGTQLSSTISDFTEAAQDAIGAAVADTISVNLTYDDSVNEIRADVLPAGVDHALLGNLNSATYTHLTSANHTDLTDGGETALHTHQHNALNGKQGGTTGEYYHATSAEYSELQRSDNVDSSAVNIALDDTRRTVLMTATGKTVTLPAASAARIGKDWTVILGVAGYTDIASAGSDTLTLPTNDTTIRLDNKGASITLRCLTASSWGIA